MVEGLKEVFGSLLVSPSFKELTQESMARGVLGECITCDLSLFRELSDACFRFLRGPSYDTLLFSRELGDVAPQKKVLGRACGTKAVHFNGATRRDRADLQYATRELAQGFPMPG